MRNKPFILVAAFVGLLIAAAAAVYVYDQGREDTIAKGVSIAGIDVGGLSPALARNRLENELLGPLREPITISHGDRRWRLGPREAVLKQREHQRLDPLLRSSAERYRYEEDVEEFLRWSPSVRAGAGKRPSAQQLAEVQKVIAALQEGDESPVNVAPRRTTAPESFDDLTARDIVGLLPKLDPGDLPALREHEAAHADRGSVLRAIDDLLADRAPS